MEPEGSITHSQAPATCPYPEETWTVQTMSPHPTFWKSIFISSIYTYVFHVVCSHQFSPPTTTLYAPGLYPICSTYPAYLILQDLISRTIFGEE